MDKLVSIILPTYNGAERIKEAIKSVLEQSYTNWELLVIDDGSKDNTREIVENLVKNEQRIKYLRNEINLGIQKTLNKGLREAGGVYIARIDDDDVWIDKNKLEKQVEFLENNKEYVLVGTGVVVVDEKNKVLFRYLLPIKDIDIRNKILSKNCFVHSSVVFRKDAVLKCAGYSESEDTKHIEDYDLWLNLGTLGKFANLGTHSIRFTLRAGSLSSKNKLEQFKKILKLIKNYKNIYPNYYRALFRSTARLIIYGFILKLPIKITLNKFIKFYKEN